MARLTEQDRDRLERQYRFFIHPILESLKQVKNVVAHIHKIEISTTLLADDIKLSTGREIETRPIDSDKEEHSYYTQKGSFDYFGLKCFILSYPFNNEQKSDNDADDDENFVRASIISIVPDGYIDPQRHKTLLLKLQKDLKSGDVKVRYVELTLDIFPEKKSLVPSLFESLAKIIFVPQIRDRNDIVFDGGQFYRSNKKESPKKAAIKKPKEIVERLNRVIKFSNKYKLYERSQDKKRIKATFYKNGTKKSVKAYRKKHLDRVRFEQNFDREQLRKKQIYNLIDFVNHTNSDGMNILYILLKTLSFRVIDTGPRKFDYVCLMYTVKEKKPKRKPKLKPIKKKNKRGSYHELRRLHAKLLRNKIKRAIHEHSAKWQHDPTDIKSFLGGQKT